MITFCTSGEFTLQIEGVGRTEYNIILIQEIGKDMPVDDFVTETGENPVKSSGIWAALQSLWVACSTALGLHLDASVDAHKSSAISHGSGSVEDRLDNITDGVITKDFDDNIISITTFGETTTFNRDVNGDIESWENDTHIWNLTKENGEITGWTLTEKP